MLTIAALNAPKAPPAASVPVAGGRGGAAAADGRGGGGGREETLEAAEARCVAALESALALVQGEPERAKAAFEALLAEPLMLAVAAAEGGGEEGATAATSSLAAAVRSAALRALAGLLAASEDNTDATRALGLFAQAALAASGPGGAGTDVVTWQRLGTLAAELRMWPLSRQALEAGLRANPSHPLLLEALASLCLRLGDWRAAAAAAGRLLDRDPGHEGARAVLRAACSAAGGGGANLSEEEYREAMSECDPPAFPSRDRGAGGAAAEEEQGERQRRERVSLKVGSATWSSLLCSLADAVFEERAAGDSSSSALLLSLPVEVEISEEEAAATRGGAGDDEVARRVQRIRDAAASPQKNKASAAPPAAAAAAAPAPAARTGSASIRGPMAPPTRAVTGSDGNAASASASASASAAAAPVDALSGVLPWLGEPPLAPPTTPGAGGATASAAPTPQKKAGQLQQERPSAEEAEAVSALAAAATAAGASLGAFAAAVVDAAAVAAASPGSSSLTRLAAYALLSLEPFSRGWRRSPQAALALAELHAAVAVEADTLVGRPDEEEDDEEEKRSADGEKSGKASSPEFPPAYAIRSSMKRAEAEHSEAAAACLASAMPLLSDAAAANNNGGAAPSSSSSSSCSPSSLVARWHWVAGRLAELRRSPTAAAAHYGSCQAACGEMGGGAENADADADDAGQGKKKGRPKSSSATTANAPPTSTALPLTPRVIRLPLVASLVGQASAPEAATSISAAAAAARVQALGLLSALETGRDRLERGGPEGAAALVEELAPRVLAPCPAAAAAAAAGGGGGGAGAPPSSAAAAISPAATAAAATGEARRKLAEAALLLQDAAAAAGEQHDATQLRARMLILSSMLPRPPSVGSSSGSGRGEQGGEEGTKTLVSRPAERHAARFDASDGAPPGTADPSRAAGAKLERLLGSLTRFALTLADKVDEEEEEAKKKKKTSSPSLSSLVAPGTAAARELHELLWRVAAHVERCFWACGIAECALKKEKNAAAAASAAGGSKAAAPPAAAAASSAAVKAAAKNLDAARRALGTAAAALIALWRLDPRADRSDKGTAALLRALGELARSRELPGARRAPMLRAAARALAAAVARLDDGSGGDADANMPNAHDDDPHDLRGALAAALGALYGADLPGRDPDWPAAEGLSPPSSGARPPSGAATGAGGAAAPAAASSSSSSPTGGVAPLSTVSDCLEAWRLLEPAALLEVREAERRQQMQHKGGRARARAGRRSPLARLDPALRALEEATPAPREEVLAAWDPEKLLDGVAGGAGGGGAEEWPSERELVEARASAVASSSSSSPSPSASFLDALLRVPPSLAAAVAADPCSPVHASLHLARTAALAGGAPSAAALGAQLFSSGPAAAAGAFLSGAGPGAGAAALARATRQPLLALRYSPRDPRPWRALALAHAAAAEALLADAAAAPAARWRADERSRARLELWRRRALRAALVWRALSPPLAESNGAAEADEAAGRALLSAASRDPPADPRAPRGRHRRVGGGEAEDSAARAAAASLAAEAFQRAMEEDPRSWRAPFLRGRALEKAAAFGGGGGAAAEAVGGKLAALPLYARACALAATDAESGYGSTQQQQQPQQQPGRTLLEPLYRLHACRLKLALAAQRACRGGASEGQHSGAQQQAPPASSSPPPSPPFAVLDAVSRWCFSADNAAKLEPLLLKAKEEEERGGGTGRAAVVPLPRVVALADDGADSDDDARASLLPPPRRPSSSSSISASDEALELLLDDALEALAWCAEADRYYHKARYRLARGLAARGVRGGRGAAAAEEAPPSAAAAAALAALKPLFSASGSSRLKYCIATYQITEEGGGGGADVDDGDDDEENAGAAGAGGEGGARKRRGGSGASSSSLSSLPPPPPPPPPTSSPAADPFYGSRPPRGHAGGIRGAGEAETWRGHARRVAAHVRLHARLAAAACDADALAAAASFLSSRANREGLPGLEAAARLVLGLHFRAVAAALRERAGGTWLVEAPSASSASSSSPAVVIKFGPAATSRSEPPTPEALQALERAFALYSAHSLFPPRSSSGVGGVGGGSSSGAAAGVPGLRELAEAAAAGNKGAAAASSAPPSDPWATEQAFAAAARAHAAALEASGEFAPLAALATSIRNRHRGPSGVRDAPRSVRLLCSEAAAGASRAVVRRLAAMERAAAAGARAEAEALSRNGGGEGGGDEATATAATEATEVVTSERARELLASASPRALSSARDSRVAAASALGFPLDKGWALLKFVASARRSGGWGGGGGGGAAGDGSGSNAAAASSPSVDLDALLKRAYAAYCWLHFGAALGVAPPSSATRQGEGKEDEEERVVVPFDVSLSEAHGGADDLSRAAQRAIGGGGGGGGASGAAPAPPPEPREPLVLRQQQAAAKAAATAAANAATLKAAAAAAAAVVGEKRDAAGAGLDEQQEEQQQQEKEKERASSKPRLSESK